jgi:ABC-2 type transport system ATP-binding protein
MPGQAVIEVEDLKKHYGEVRAVDGISFSIDEGTIFAFLGPNGAGKTTTVEMAEMIRTPTSGTIRVFGGDLGSNMAEVRRRIGVLPQEFKSYDRLTVRETLLYYQALYHEKVWDVDEIISLLNLEPKKDTPYMELSGGLKQRVGVGMALVNDPDIVFLDEPTTGLDPRARREVWEIIRLLKKKGKTVFLTTHYMEEAEQLADMVCIIHKGKIIARGTVEELIAAHGKRSVLTVIGCDRDCMAGMGAETGMEVKVSGNQAHVVVPDTDAIMRVLTYLKDNGLAYREIDIQRSTLEEVFLSLTGEKLGGDEEDES